MALIIVPAPGALAYPVVVINSKLFLNASVAFYVRVFFIDRTIDVIIIAGAVNFQFISLWLMEFWIHFAPLT